VSTHPSRFGISKNALHTGIPTADASIWVDEKHGKIRQFAEKKFIELRMIGLRGFARRRVA